MWLFFDSVGCRCWCDSFIRLKCEILFICMCVWLCLSVFFRCCLILCWFFVDFMLMKLIMIRLLRLCRCSWWVILLVVLRFVWVVVFLMFVFLVVCVEFMLIVMSVLVWLIMIVLFDGSGIVCEYVVLIWCLIWKWENSGMLL